MVAPAGWRALRAALALSLAATLLTGGLVGAWVEHIQASVLPPLSSHVRLVPLPTGPSPHLSTDDVGRLAALPDVKSVQQALSVEDTVYALSGINGARVAAIIHATSDAWPRMAGVRIASGRSWRTLEHRAPVALISGPWPILPTKIVWRGRVIQVIGRFVGSSAADEVALQVWVPLAFLERFPGRASYLLEVVDKPYADARVAAAATAMLETRYGQLADGEPPVLAITYEAQRDAVALARRALYLTLFAFCAIPFLLLGGGVAAALRLAVSRRVPEIGLRRAVGATRQAIVDLFVGEAVLLAWGASWRGALIAIFAADVARMVGLPLHLPLALVFLFASLPWLVCFASAVTPAIEAAELQPIVALDQV